MHMVAIAAYKLQKILSSPLEPNLWSQGIYLLCAPIGWCLLFLPLSMLSDSFAHLPFFDKLMSSFLVIIVICAFYWIFVVPILFILVIILRYIKRLNVLICLSFTLLMTFVLAVLGTEPLWSTFLHLAHFSFPMAAFYLWLNHHRFFDNDENYAN